MTVMTERIARVGDPDLQIMDASSEDRAKEVTCHLLESQNGAFLVWKNSETSKKDFSKKEEPNRNSLK